MGNEHLSGNTIVKDAKIAPVSVIIPTYRDGDALRRALNSVEYQTVRPSQVIVVDDASLDGNAERICNASDLDDIQLVSLEKNVGPGGARNAGIAIGRQPFIAFLDADDEWHPEKLERQMSVMLQPGAPSLSCHDKAFNGAPWLTLSETARSSVISRRMMLFANLAPISTVIVRRDAIKYEFPQTYASEDYVFVAANALSGASAVLLHQVLARAHKPAFGAGGLSGRLHAMQLGEMRARYFMLKERLTTPGEYGLLLLWGALKYVRRLAIVSCRTAAGRLAAKQR